MDPLVNSHTWKKPMDTTEFLKLFEEDEMDFSGQDLHDIDLECLNLDGFDFSHANLRSAHLQKASLETADLTWSLPGWS